jgi:MoaA/NifB/PqqE/SkfB family radical SAM enzyme
VSEEKSTAAQVDLPPLIQIARPAKKDTNPLPWPPRPLYHSGGTAASLRPSTGAVTWNITTACNYRCSYCTQPFLENRKRLLKDAPAFVEAFGRLPGTWEVKISGGEPFTHPALDEIAAGLRRRDHLVSVVTNLSADRDRLAAFIDSAADSLRVFSASFHAEYAGRNPAELEAFVEKCRWTSTRLNPEASFNVTCVATRENLPRLTEYGSAFAAAGVAFKVQPEKRDREVAEYTEEERGLLLTFGGHNMTGAIAHDFSGRPCWAGALYFTLDDRGHAWRCYPARRYRRQYLGNFLSQDFTLARGPSPCLYSYCNCTVPIERGMTPGSQANTRTDAAPLQRGAGLKNGDLIDAI